jgi:hypothetical protein
MDYNYTMLNGNVVTLSYKKKMTTMNAIVVIDIEKARELRKELVKLLMSKKHLMEVDEKMKFLEVDEKLYSWINKQTGNITSIVIDAIRILKSYNKTFTM